jgi:CubicO group peptidase (beta-lactamase class C family)
MPAVSPDLAATWTRRLQEAQRDSRVPSVVAGLSRDGALLWSGGAGSGALPDADTQYRCGSISKTFVAVSVLRLRDEGRLDLEDRLGRHLPDAALPRATIAQLLSHTAGTRAETPAPWWERSAGGDSAALNAALADSPAALRPGSYHYSNVGFALLGQLVERLRGASWRDVARAELLAPLGLYRTTPRPVGPFAPGYAVHPFADVVLPEPEFDAGAMAPAGQLWSCVNDLTSWAAFLAGEHPGGPDVLATSTLTEMARVRTVDDGPDEAWTRGYGLGLQTWNVGGRRSFGHGGSMPGFLATLRVSGSPGALGSGGHDAVVVMANTTTGLDVALAGDLLDSLAQDLPRPVTPWAPAAVSADVLELLGLWYWGPSPLILRATGDLLDLTALELGRESRFRPAGDGTWVGLDGYYAGETLCIKKGPDGRTVALDLASFILTRTPYQLDSGVPGEIDPRGWHAPTDPVG